MSHKYNDTILDLAQEHEINVQGKDLESVWAELNRGIVMSAEPLSFDEVSELIY